MSTENDPDRWARLRFAIIGHLLAAPPPRGELRAALEALAAKTWTHPVHGGAMQPVRRSIRWRPCGGAPATMPEASVVCPLP